jgi:hypothetical protein
MRAIVARPGLVIVRRYEGQFALFDIHKEPG